MKKILKYITMSMAAAALAMAGTSCTDYLDKSPDSDISDQDAFKDFQNFQGYTELLYNNMPDFCRGYWTNSFNWGDDELISSDVNYHMVYKIDNGDFWGWQAEFDGWGTGWLDRNGFNKTSNDRFNKGLWPAAWWGIRHANMGLENLDKLTDATQEQKDAIEGQLLFFRGWYHFMLIQYFGGLPYIDKVIDANEPINEPRLTYRECADKAGADFERAAKLLPIDWDNTRISPATKGNNQLRINKIIALAYAGKNYLWAASPLMSGGVGNKGAKKYDEEYAKKAADCLGELLQLVETGQTQYALVDFEKYSDIFFTYGQGGKIPGSTEALLRHPASDGYNGCRWGWLLQYSIYPYNVGGCKLSACANYVNYFGMANGLPLNDPESGFDKTKPWKGRDPRFYATIYYDGVQMTDNEKCESDYPQEDYQHFKMYTGSPSRDPIQGSRTGYVTSKYHSRKPETGIYDCNDWDDGYGWSPHLTSIVCYMRLADVYLMYAEAAAQGWQNPRGKSSKVDLTALEALNIIRNRAGVKNVAAKYSGDLAGFMSELRRERAVELSFEGHRFNDLRRWLLLDDPAYADKTSQEFDRLVFNPDKPEESTVSNFHEEVVVHRSYGDKHYWLPLKKKDCEINASFYQNPGW